MRDKQEIEVYIIHVRERIHLESFVPNQKIKYELPVLRLIKKQNIL